MFKNGIMQHYYIMLGVVCSLCMFSPTLHNVVIRRGYKSLICVRKLLNYTFPNWLAWLCFNNWKACRTEFYKKICGQTKDDVGQPNFSHWLSTGQPKEKKYIYICWWFFCFTKRVDEIAKYSVKNSSDIKWSDNMRGVCCWIMFVQQWWLLL